MLIFYNLISNLIRGDMVIINDHCIYFFDIIDNQKFLHQGFDTPSITIVSNNFLIFFFDEFPPLYWNRALDTYNRTFR